MVTPDARGQGAFPILGADAHIVFEIDVNALLINETLNQTTGDALTSGSTPSEICGSDHLDRDAEAQRFQFSESTQQTGCAEYGYPFTPPPGATRVVARFQADRTVTSQANQADTPIVAEQIVRLRDPAGRIIGETHYFDSTLGSQSARPFSIEFPLPSTILPTDALNLTWYFADDGYSPVALPVSVGSGHAFASNVTDPKITFPPIPLGRGTFANESYRHENGTNITARAYALDVTDLRRTSADHGQVVVRIDPHVLLTAIETPNGETLAPDQFRENETRDSVTYSFDDEALDTFGRGAYRFVFETRAALPPPPPPSPPDRIYPLAWLLLALPALTGTMAVREGVSFRRKASEPFMHAARNLLIAIGFAAAVYFVLLVYTLFFDRIDAIATLPIVLEGWLLAVQLLLVALLFLFLALYPGRYLVGEMTRDLERRARMQAELERSNRELEQFAYVASHDLQEPLRTVAGYAQLLQRRYADKVDDKGVHYIDRTVAGTERMQRLIQDLLAYSRIQTRGEAFHDVDMNDIAVRLVDDLGLFIHEHGAEVEFGDLPTISADGSQMEQLLSNLVRNGIKYRHPDRKPVVRIDGRDEGNWWHFTVEDNGEGIPEDQYDRIFVLFQRLVPRERDDVGTGIGLAIAKRIVERHGGRIWVESRMDEGSTFHFTIAK